MKLPRIVPFLAVAIGCANPSHLVFHQGTVIGVDVAANPDAGTVHGVFGYDRQTAALVPASDVDFVDAEANPPVKRREREAMSVVAYTKVLVAWLQATNITEQFATGTAAVNVAKNPQALAELMTPPPTTPPAKEVRP